MIALLFLLLGIACAVAFLVDSPLGSNVTRFRALVLPLGLLVLGLAGWRPRWLAAICLVLASVYTFSPYVAAATGLGDTRAARAEFWRPALAFLRADPNPNYRVDVVPTFDNWEAYYVPQAGFALARGWYRQLDLVRNPALYRATLTGPEYREWLRANGVRYVLLPRVQLDRVAATAQAELLRSGRSGLVEVADLPDWTVYELPDATPILTGPGRRRPHRARARTDRRLDACAGVVPPACSLHAVLGGLRRRLRRADCGWHDAPGHASCRSVRAPCREP